MKRVFTAICLAGGMAVGLAAQQQSTTASQDTQQGQRAPRSVTLTGCLRAGDTASTYTLTDVTGLPDRSAMGSAAAGSSTAGGTETGTSGTSSAGRSVTLTPAADVDLAPHVGHKVEVAGTMGRGSRGGGASGGTTAGNTGTTGGTMTGGGSAAGSASSTAAQGQSRRMPTVAVTSVRMIAESCS